MEEGHGVSIKSLLSHEVLWGFLILLAGSEALVKGVIRTLFSVPVVIKFPAVRWVKFCAVWVHLHEVFTVQ